MSAAIAEVGMAFGQYLGSLDLGDWALRIGVLLWFACIWYMFEVPDTRSKDGSWERWDRRSAVALYAVYACVAVWIVYRAWELGL